jgi:hypothetical protein
VGIAPVHRKGSGWKPLLFLYLTNPPRRGRGGSQPHRSAKPDAVHPARNFCVGSEQPDSQRGPVSKICAEFIELQLTHVFLGATLSASTGNIWCSPPIRPGSPRQSTWNVHLPTTRSGVFSLSSALLIPGPPANHPIQRTAHLLEGISPLDEKSAGHHAEP